MTIFPRRLVLSAVSACLLLGLVATSAQAAAGDLDPGFGKGGVRVESRGAAQAVLHLPGGKILTGGPGNWDEGSKLFRYNPDGSLDESFASGGSLETDFGENRFFGLKALARQPDGKIVAAGEGGTWDASTETGTSGFALARFNADGSLDTDFGDRGLVITENFTPAPEGGYPSYDSLADVVVQPDGKIVAAGSSTDSETGTSGFALARFNADGSLDDSFGAGGKVTTPIRGGSRIEGLVLQPDGKLVAGGMSGASAWGDSDFTLARYNADGTLDTTFGGDENTDGTPDGWTKTEVKDYSATYSSEIKDLALDADGTIVAAGSARDSSWRNSFALARYKSDGTLDESFGSYYPGNGLLIRKKDRSDGAAANAVAIASDGKIVAAGYDEDPNADGALFAVARYHSSGSPDRDFGGDGDNEFRSTNPSDGPWSGDIANDVAVQPDGKVIAAGSADTQDQHFALARYMGNDTDDVGDLSVTASSAPEPVQAGHRLTYKLAVTNHGPANSFGVSLTDLLPAAVTVEDVSASQGLCKKSGRRIDCDLYGLAPGAAATVEIAVSPDEPGTYTNSATVEGTNSDPRLANNSDSARATVVAAEGERSSTDAMKVARSRATETVLKDGRVLVVGGMTSDEEGREVPTGSAEVYDPDTKTWRETKPLATARADHTATLLPSGKVLVAGGGPWGLPHGNGPRFASAELWDPATGEWSSAGDLKLPRAGHTATLLRNGKVLVAGGCCKDTDEEWYNYSANQAELYDPEANSWTEAAPMRWERSRGTATLLPDGKVLVVGGARGHIHGLEPNGPTYGAAEIYDPNKDAWSEIEDVSVARSDHTATLLPDGKVLVAGGSSQGGNWGGREYGATRSAEVYDPASGQWSPPRQLAIRARTGHTATLLSNGKVLLAGGTGAETNCCGLRSLRSIELFDPGQGTFSSAGLMADARTRHTASLLSNGKVLLAGGHTLENRSQRLLSSAELYTPADRTAPTAPTITSPANNSYDTDGSFAVRGSAEPGSRVRLYEGTGLRGTATAAAGGGFSIALTGVANGRHVYTARATDAAGNTSSPSAARAVIVDKTRPAVRAVSPVAGATGISTLANVFARFSEPMRASTITRTTVRLVRRGTTRAVSARVTYDAARKRAKLDPTRRLARGVTYTAKVTTWARDRAGNRLARAKSWSFRTRR